MPRTIPPPTAAAVVGPWLSQIVGAGSVDADPLQLGQELAAWRRGGPAPTMPAGVTLPAELVRLVAAERPAGAPAAWPAAMPGGGAGQPQNGCTDPQVAPHQPPQQQAAASRRVMICPSSSSRQRGAAVWPELSWGALIASRRSALTFAPFQTAHQPPPCPSCSSHAGYA